MDEEKHKAASDDAEWWRANDIAMAAADGVENDRSKVESACAVLFEKAIEAGDRLMIAVAFARFDDFVRNEIAPPYSMLRAINKSFSRFRGPGNISMDKAFGLTKGNRGRPHSMAKRLWAETDAKLVAHWCAIGDSLEVAIEKVAYFRSHGDRLAMRGISEAQIKRNFLKYRRRI